MPKPCSISRAERHPRYPWKSWSCRRVYSLLCAKPWEIVTACCPCLRAVSVSGGLGFWIGMSGDPVARVRVSRCHGAGCKGRRDTSLLGRGLHGCRNSTSTSAFSHILFNPHFIDICQRYPRRDIYLSSLVCSFRSFSVCFDQLN